MNIDRFQQSRDQQLGKQDRRQVGRLTAEGASKRHNQKDKKERERQKCKSKQQMQRQNQQAQQDQRDVDQFYENCASPYVLYGTIRDHEVREWRDQSPEKDECNFYFHQWHDHWFDD